MLNKNSNEKKGDNSFPVLDREPLERSVARIFKETIVYGVNPDWAGGCENSADATLYWDSKRGEWLAKIDGTFLESSWDKDTGGILNLPYTHGPFMLNLSACKKILEAYRIPESFVESKNISLEAISKTNPEKLREIMDMPSGTGVAYSINFSVKGDNDNYAVDWNWHEKGKWTISCREYGLGHGWQNEGPLNKCGYSGKQAYQALLQSFGLESRAHEFPIDRIMAMSPAELAKASGKNPESGTLGDHRRASEV